MKIVSTAIITITVLFFFPIPIIAEEDQPITLVIKDIEIGEFYFLSEEEQLSYYITENPIMYSLLQIYAVNNTALTRRLVYESSDFSEWRDGAIQFANNRKYCFYYPGNVGTRYDKSPFYFINGVTGTVTYLFDIPDGCRVSMDGKYLLLQETIRERDYSTRFRGIVVNLEMKTVIKDYSWNVKNGYHNDLDFCIIRTEKSFQILHIVEGGYVDAIAEIDTDNFSFNVIMDKSGQGDIKLSKSSSDDVLTLFENPEFKLNLSNKRYTDHAISPNTLEENKHLEHIEFSTENYRDEAVINSTKKSSVPLWAWIVIGGAVVVVGGVVVFAVKRKKR